MSEQRRGFLLGVAAYVLWGAFPLYFPLLKPASATEILAHRVVWSLVSVLVLVLVVRRWSSLRRVLANPRARTMLLIAGVVIGANWFTYIWGVNNGHVVEAALGYFINPLVTVLMGVLVLGERLRRVQWMALGVAFIAVIWLTVEHGRPPWISLVLAFSFGTYGLAKKKAASPALEGLTIETAVLAPIALGYLVFLQAGGDSTLTTDGALHVLLLIATGLVTVIPLLCFGGAANRISLSTIGLLQYLAPILQFAIGVLIMHERMSTGRWAGFVLVWIALIMLTVESLHHRKQVLRRAFEPEAAEADRAVTAGAERTALPASEGSRATADRPGDAAPGDAAPGDAAPGDEPSGTLPSGELESGSLASRDRAAENISENMTPEAANASPGAAAPHAARECSSVEPRGRRLVARRGTAAAARHRR